MSTVSAPLPERLVRLGCVACLFVLVVVWPTALLIDQTKMTVTLIAPLDDGAVAANLFGYVPGEEPLADVFGGVGTQEVIVLPDDDRILVPKDDPRLQAKLAEEGTTLSAADERLVLYRSESGHRSTTRQFVFWLARWTTIGAGAGLIVLWVLGTFLRRRSTAAG